MICSRRKGFVHAYQEPFLYIVARIIQITRRTVFGAGLMMMSLKMVITEKYLASARLENFSRNDFCKFSHYPYTLRAAFSTRKRFWSVSLEERNLLANLNALRRPCVLTHLKL